MPQQKQSSSVKRSKGTERRTLERLPLRQLGGANPRDGVRGSSRRITTMTAALQPTREYQCDQPSSSPFGRFSLPL